MNKHFRRALLALATLFLAVAAEAAPVRIGSYTVTHPDGKNITVYFKGDEFYKLTTTSDGAAVSLEEDGYLHYVIFENGESKVTKYIVGDKNTPNSVIAKAKNIPYMTLQNNAKEMRKAFAEALSQTRTGFVPATKADKKLNKAPVIIVEFPDLKLSYGDKDKFHNLLNQEGYSENGADGSAKDYFKAQFGDLADFEFDVYGPYTAKNGYKYYGENLSNGNDRTPELIVEACKALDADIDFSQYDQNGDGVCDFVFMFFAGNDEASNPAKYKDNIWSHAYVVDYYDRNCVLDGKRLSSYACTSEIRPGGGMLAGIGTFCHEFSHILGLMDAYDTSYDYDGLPTAEALWLSTSLMDGGGYNNNSNTPPYYNAFEREMLGIATAVEPQLGEMTLAPINESNQFIRIETDKKDEYFIIENRYKSGWDKYIPTSGMVIYHIDKSTNSAGPSYYYGRNVSAKERWTYNEVNSYPKHQCADLIEAGNNTKASNAAEVFFPGTKKVTHCSSKTHSAYKTWSGNDVDFEVYDIKQSDKNITFQLIENGALELPVAENIEVKIIGNNAIVSWTTDKEDPEAKAKIELALKTGGAVISSGDPEGTSYVFEGLKEDTEYTISIYYQKGENNGEKVSYEFSTTEIAADFPAILLDRNSLVKDNTIALKIVNLADGCQVEWYLNEYHITTPDKFVLAFDGEKELKAIITYPDGTKESVITTVKLTESSETGK